MIQSSACTCMIWYHIKYVAIPKQNPIGMWLCPSYRFIPPDLASGIKLLKDDVASLNQTTMSILTSVKCLSTNTGNDIENLHDWLTALHRQINAKDLCTTVMLESLSNSADNNKTISTKNHAIYTIKQLHSRKNGTENSLNNQNN